MGNKNQSRHHFTAFEKKIVIYFYLSKKPHTYEKYFYVLYE